MSLVNQKEILLPAFEAHQAIGAFNANNMEMVQAQVRAAEEITKELGRPQDLIIQISPGAARYAGWTMGSVIAKTAAEESSVRVSLNLDHGVSFEEMQRALDCGFTAGLFDGSALPLEENISLTKKVVVLYHEHGIPVEAELGKIPRIEDYFSTDDIAYLRTMSAAQAVKIIREKAGESVTALMAKPEDVERFVAETDCDFLAAAFGSIHGIWDDIWPIRLDRLIAIQERVHMPLVCHGSSGVLMRPEDAPAKEIELAEGEATLLEAIQTGGVTKVNVATALSIAFINGFTKAYESNTQEKDFRKLGGPARDAVKEITKKYMRLFAGV